MYKGKLAFMIMLIIPKFCYLRITYATPQPDG